MQRNKQVMKITDSVVLGEEKPVLFAGPCAVESFDICMEIGSKTKAWAEQHGFSYVFKASFDKANRTSSASFRSIGMDKSLAVLQRVGKELQVPLVTDIHESYQAKEVAEVVDVLQIPAFLCRQTDLLLAAAETGKAVKIKRGQFMAPEDMQYAVSKVRAAGNDNVCLTERGFSLGYHNLVVDMRGLPIMRQFAPVVFDITHSVQQPGGQGGSSGGQREFAPILARAAAATGIDGFFIETHPEPSKALSDGPNLIPLHKMGAFLEMLKEAWVLGRKYQDFEVNS
ncbi:3-deoxy-8-phosphooctulonate synthase [Algoriphagus halophytocola]|uniref:2-dehydro-3-deoxyphosphooctonate aldolase n=1 Tax=Algoriphagus halophytocola TaxID=2991499 RepID=A0ABY6MM44_9BACT|nr:MULTISPECIES: 3-deoxy-8-phosphooctulonate synthase [unclassified Algoriphagus]UZD24220.1 3-deoxy-8-phosphooctulonate synthase [Algoriphagus sp. TR-M5]WBL41589.1 3-deoxy-8-phosphooctulonate synthase [Algoriphagus sp. TR-M9]